MYRILILEDDVIAQRIWHSRLKAHLNEVEIIKFPSIDLLSEIEQSDLNSYDLIIADIFLSGDKTGLDLIASFPQVTQKRCLVTSSISVEKFATYASEKSLCCKFLQKPLHPSAVLACIDEILGTKTLQVDNLTSIVRQSESEGPVFLITGCSSGVGAALADQLVKSKYYRIVLTVRERSLDAMKFRYPQSSRLLILPMDLSDQKQVNSTVNLILAKWGRIDVLINNAGICYRSTVEQMVNAAEDIQMRTNYLGPMQLIRAVIPGMREHGRGKIINVTSVSGILGMPTMGSYSASKHALEAASESMWYELRPFGINVSVVRPGFVNNMGYTHVASSSKAQLASLLHGPYFDFYKFMADFVANLMRISPSNSDDVAAVILKVVKSQNPKLWVNATLDAKIFCALQKMIPANLFHVLLNLILFKMSGLGRSQTRAKKNRLSA